MMSIDEFLIYTDAAKRANVSRPILVSWVKEGLLTEQRVLNRYVVRVAELDKLLEVRAEDPSDWKHRWKLQRNK